MKCKDNKYRLVSLLEASTEAKENDSEMQADIVQTEEAVTPDTDAKMIVSKWLFWIVFFFVLKQPYFNTNNKYIFFS